MNLLASIVALLAAAPASAPVKGTFWHADKNYNIDARFTPVDAFAWEEPSQDDPQAKVIRVWLSEKPLDRQALVSCADLRAELFRQSGKERFLELEFDSAGHWTNTAWKLPATMCGLCGDDGAYGKSSKVKIVNGQIQATLRVQPSDYAADSVAGPTIDLTLEAKVERRLTKATARPF